MTVPFIIEAVVAAVNAGDREQFLDLFIADGVVDDWGSIYQGREAIAEWCDRELIGAEAHFTLLESDQQGDVASMMVDVDGNGFVGPSRFTFTLADDRIERMRITAD